MQPPKYVGPLCRHFPIDFSFVWRPPWRCLLFHPAINPCQKTLHFYTLIFMQMGNRNEAEIVFELQLSFGSRPRAKLQPSKERLAFGPRLQIQIQPYSHIAWAKKRKKLAELDSRSRSTQKPKLLKLSWPQHGNWVKQRLATFVRWHNTSTGSAKNRGNIYKVIHT